MSCARYFRNRFCNTYILSSVHIFEMAKNIGKVICLELLSHKENSFATLQCTQTSIAKITYDLPVNVGCMLFLIQEDVVILEDSANTMAL